jgi:IgGFc binding protein
MPCPSTIVSSTPATSILRHVDRLPAAAAPAEGAHEEQRRSVPALPTRRKRRRTATSLHAQACVESHSFWIAQRAVALCVLLLMLQSTTRQCHGQGTTTSPSSPYGTSFVVARLDHTDRAYCQGTMAVLLVNPDPHRVASVRIETGAPPRRVRQLTILPSDQLMYEDTDCLSLLDADHDEIPDAQQVDTTTPENVTRILPFHQFTLQIRSDIPVQAYASTTRRSADNVRDLSLLLPAEALGTTYRLVDFVGAAASERGTGAGRNNEVASDPQHEVDVDDDTNNDGGNPQETNRTRYTTFGIVAGHGTGDTANDSGGSNTGGGDPAAAASSTTTVYLRNDVTGQQSPTYELQMGEVLWYRSRTIATPTPATAATRTPETTTATRQGPSNADGYFRISPRPHAEVDAVDVDGDGRTATNEEEDDNSSDTSNDGLYDITGWHVVASQPVAVFVGSYGEMDSDQIDASSNSKRPSVRFQTFQQLVPESALGSTYMVCPIEAAAPPKGGNVTCDSDNDERFAASCQDPINRIRYIATRNDTTLTLVFPESDDDEPADGTMASSTRHIYLEMAGQYYDLETTRPHHAMSNFPLYVYQSLADNAPPDEGATSSNLRSSSMMLVPSMDQLLKSTGASTVPSAVGAQASFPPPIRVTVQHDASSLRLLHATSNRIALNDEFVVDGGGITDDRMDDDALYRSIRQQRQKRQCRAVGTWMGVEYCCTQLDQVSAGMYTITTAPSSSQTAGVAEVQHPIGISVMSVGDERSAVDVASKPSKGAFLAQFFRPDPMETPDAGEGADEIVSSTRTDIRASPVPTGSSSPGSTGTSNNTSSSSGGSNGSSAAVALSSRRVYGYSGGMVAQEVMAQCSTGGPYEKRVFQLPSINFPLAGEATCRNDTLPARVTWSSSSTANDDVIFSSPTRITTKVRFQQPGLFTLCMAVTCDDDLEDTTLAQAGASCCGTFEIIQDACDAGGPYRMELPDSDLPASLQLDGAVDTCEDGTAPDITWFLNTTDDDPKRKNVVFVKPDQLDTRVSVSAFGKYEVCLKATCGKSDLLHHECCTRIRVRKLSTEAGRPEDEPATRNAPSEVIQESPTSSIAGRPSRQPVPASLRDNERRRPASGALDGTSPSPTVKTDVGRTEPGSLPSRSESPTKSPGRSHLGLATEPRVPTSPSTALHRNGSRPEDGRKRDDDDDDDGSTRDEAGSGGGKDRRRHDGPRKGGGGGKRGDGGEGGRDAILPKRASLNIFFRGGW